MTLEGLLESTITFRKKFYKVKKSTLVAVTYNLRNRRLVAKFECLPSSGGSIHLQTIVFNKCDWDEVQSEEFPLYVEDKNGKAFYIPMLSTNKTEIQVKCSCPSSRYDWEWYNKNNVKGKSALIGQPRKYKKVPGSNRPPRNPNKIPGLCKHLVESLVVLQKNQGLDISPESLSILKFIKKNTIG